MIPRYVQLEDERRKLQPADWGPKGHRTVPSHIQRRDDSERDRRIMREVGGTDPDLTAAVQAHSTE